MTIKEADPFISEMVDDATYDDEAGEITITMMSGNDYTWPCDDAMWADFNNAPSKGHWVRTVLEGYVE